MTKTVLQDAFDHHIWATLRLLDACEALTPDQLETTVPGTYGSLIATLRHTVGADRGYLTLLANERLPRLEDEDEGVMDLAVMRDVMEADGPVWDELVAGDLDAGREVVRHRDDGSTSTAPLGVRLAQVIHHGTDHRSQVCTALTTLGIEPPEIDVWAWADSEGRLGETPPTMATA
jgi:uncharacterized damage-inducible protein DinB